MASRRVRGPCLTAAIKVRESAEGDLERIAEIKIRNWTDTYGPLIPAETLQRFLDPAEQLAYMRKVSARPDAILLVAEAAGGGVIGFALTYVDEKPHPWLESLHVHPDFQGRGAGTLLMRATAQAIRARGLATMRLGVVEGNTAAERFYERIGGTPDGREPASWAGGVIHHVYRWSTLDPLLETAE